MNTSQTKKTARETRSWIILTLVLFLSMAFGLKTNAEEAQSQTPPSIPDIKIDRLTIPLITNGKLLSQNGNKLELSFDILGTDKIWPGIKYSVSVVKNTGKVASVMDAKTYDDVIDLPANRNITKQITYETPDFLNGTFRVYVVVQDYRGTNLGFLMVDKPVTLNGSGQFIEPSSENLYLKVKGENPEKQYALMQGVDIERSETLVLHAKLANHFNQEVSFIPQFKAFEPSIIFGKLASIQKGTEVYSLKAGEEKEFDFIISRPDASQTYDSEITFVDGQNKVISSPIFVHYIIHGQSASIYSFKSEKDRYLKGETAKFSVEWTGSSKANYSLRNNQDNIGEGNTGYALEVEAKNDENKSCFPLFSRKLTNDEQFNSVNIYSVVTEDCIKATITARIKDSKGNILDEYAINLESNNQNEAAAHKAVMEIKSKPVFRTIWLLASILAIIALISVIIFFIWKRKKKDVPLEVLIFLAAGILFFSGNPTKASEDGPALQSPANGTEMAELNANFTWARPSGFTPGFTDSGINIYQLIIKNSSGGVVYDSGTYSKEAGNVCLVWVSGEWGGCATYSYNYSGLTSENRSVNISVPKGTYTWEVRALKYKPTTTQVPVSYCEYWNDPKCHASWDWGYTYDVTDYETSPSTTLNSNQFYFNKNSVSSTFSVPGLSGYFWFYTAASYAVSINKSTYAPGETLTARGYATALCWGFNDDGSLGPPFSVISVDYPFNGPTQRQILQSINTAGNVSIIEISGSVPTTPGTYGVTFWGSAYGYTNPYTLYYTVVASDPVLAVTKSGGCGASGTIASTDGTINCGSTCSAAYPTKPSVTLNATAGDSSCVFKQWSGDCSGSTCNLPMNSNKNINAEFEPCVSTYTCQILSTDTCDSSNYGQTITTKTKRCLSSCPLYGFDPSKCSNCDDETTTCPFDKNWKEVAP